MCVTACRQRKAQVLPVCFLRQHWCLLFPSTEPVQLMTHSANDKSITEGCILHNA